MLSRVRYHNMFNFRKNTENQPQSQPEAGLFKRLRQGLTRTRSKLGQGIADVTLGKKQIDKDLLEDIESILLTADVGVQATDEIIQELTSRVERKQLNDSDSLFQALKEDLIKILQPCEQALEIPKDISPYVILMVGINGAGKTTSIGKLAKILNNNVATSAGIKRCSQL